MIKGKIFILAALLSLGLLACGGKSETPSPDSKDSAPKTSTSTANSEKSAAKSSNRKGKLIYKQYCVICHGADGTLAVSDAKDLSVSTIPIEERIDQITNGKGLMTPYKDILSAEQIQLVAEYVEELRK